MMKWMKFNDEIYLIAPFLDPLVKMSWIDEDCTFLSETEKVQFKQRINQMILKHLNEQIMQTERNAHPTSSTQGTACSPSDQPPKKKSRLLQYKCAPSPVSVAKKTALQELHEYTNDPLVCEGDQFWRVKKFEFPLLSNLVLQFLSVPAYSSPVERVCSTAGFIIRPHRCKMAYKTLQALVFLKINKKLLESLNV
jgi:hypothetical protein